MLGHIVIALLAVLSSPATTTVSVEAAETGQYGEYGKILRAEIGGVIYTIDARHRLSRARRTVARLPMNGMPYIEGAHLLMVPDDALIIAYEVADTESSGATFVALEHKTGRILWSHSIPATNVGPMRYEESRVFLSAGGVLQALDGATGKTLWALEGDWVGRDVDAFEAPVDAGEFLVYPEWTAYNAKPREFRVHKITGVVSVVRPAP